jgi:hypothetical protein
MHERRVRPRRSDSTERVSGESGAVHSVPGWEAPTRPGDVWLVRCATGKEGSQGLLGVNGVHVR